MAGDAVVGALRVVLGMDIAEFEDGIKKAGKSLGDFAKVAATIATGIELARVVEESAKAFAELVLRTIDAADAMGKASQKFGIPVAELSALKYAATLADVSFEELGKGLVILSKNMETVAGSTKNIAAAAFQSLGVSVKDASGNLKSSNDVFNEVADRFALMQDGATKTALAVALFGRAGAELIPLLNEGSHGIHTLTDEAAKLGIVLDEKTVAGATHFNDNLKKLSAVQQAVILQILGSGGLLKALEDLSFRLVDAANNTERWARVSNGLAASLEAVATWVLVAAKAFDTLSIPAQALFFSLAKIVQGDFAGAWEAITHAFGKTIPNLQEIFQLITKGKEDVSLWAETVAVASEYLEILNKKLINLKPNTFSEEQYKLGIKFGESIAKINQEADALRGTYNALAPNFVQQAQAFKDLDGFGKSFGTTLQSLTPAQMALNTALQNFRAAQITQDTLTPWQQFEQTMEKLNATMDSGKLSVQSYQIASMQAGLKLATTWGDTAQAIISPMAEAFKTLATMNKKYATAAKAAAIAEATVNTYLAATKALASVPPPFNYVAMAAVIAAGLVNVAKIAATDFATGGSFTVGGGVGGVDSQLIAFNAQPGEMVDVRRPGQQERDGGTVTVQGLNANDFIRGDMVRAMVEGLNSAFRDGYRLKFADR